MTIKEEIQDKPLLCSFDGETYKVPPTNKWDIEVLESFESEKIISAVRALVGPAQWAKFKSKTRTVEDLNAFVEVLTKATGIQGNS